MVKRDEAAAKKQLKLDKAVVKKQAKLDKAMAKKQAKLDKAIAKKQAKLDKAVAKKQVKGDKEHNVNNVEHTQLPHTKDSSTFTPATAEETAASFKEYISTKPKPRLIPSANPRITEVQFGKYIDYSNGTIKVRHSKGVAATIANAVSVNYINDKDGLEIDPEGMVEKLDNSVKGYESFLNIVQNIIGAQASRPIALLSLTVKGSMLEVETNEERDKTVIVHLLFEGSIEEFIQNTMKWISKKFPLHGLTSDSFGSDDFRTTGEFVRTAITISGAYIPLNTYAATFHFEVTNDEIVKSIIFGYSGFFTPLNDDLWCLFRTVMHNRLSSKKHGGSPAYWQQHASNMLNSNRDKDLLKFIKDFEKTKNNPITPYYDNPKEYVSSARNICMKITNLLFNGEPKKFVEQSPNYFRDIIALILDYDYASMLIKESNLIVTSNSIKAANEILIKTHAKDVKYQIRSIDSIATEMKEGCIYLYNYDGHAFEVPSYNESNRETIINKFRIDQHVYVDQLNGKTDVRFDNQTLHSAMTSIPSRIYPKVKAPNCPTINKKTWVVAYDCETSTDKSYESKSSSNKVTQRLSQFTLARLIRTDKRELRFQYYYDVIEDMSYTYVDDIGGAAYTTCNTDNTALLNSITEHMKDGSLVYFIAHNGAGFDFPLIATTIRKPWILVKVEGSAQDLPVYIHETRGIKIVFRDTMRMTGMSLVNFCKSMGLPEELTKMDIQKEFNEALIGYEGNEYVGDTWEIMNFIWNNNRLGNNADEWSEKLFNIFMKYSERDVISLMEALKTYSCLFFLQSDGLLKPELAPKFVSGASSVTKLLKRIFVNKKIVGYSSKSMFDEFIHNSPGGRVATNTFGFEIDIPNRGQRSDKQLTEECQDELKNIWNKHERRLFYADVTSLYPSAMYYYKYPTTVVTSDEERRKAYGLLMNVIKKCQSGTDEDRFKAMDRFISCSKYFYAIKFTYNGGSGIFSCIPQKGKVNSEGKLIEAIDHRILEFTEGKSHPVIRTHIELLSFLVFNKGSVFDLSIDDVEVWNSKSVFRNITATLFDKRVQYKKEGNRMEACIKLMMNSLYGKLLQSIVLTSLSKDKPEGVATKIGEKVFAGQKIGVWYNAEYQQHSAHLGMAVLAYSKYYVNRIIDCLGGKPGNIFTEQYPMFSGDTDSFMVYEDDLDKARDYLRQFRYTCYKKGQYVLDKTVSDLGAVHYDKDLPGVKTDDVRIVRYLVVAPKTYLLGLCGPDKDGKMIYYETVTAKGISKRVIDDDFKINFLKYTEIGSQQYPKLHNTTFKRHANNDVGGLTEDICDRSLPQISSIYESRTVKAHIDAFRKVNNRYDGTFDMNENRRLLVSHNTPVYLMNKHVTVSSELYEEYRKKFKPIHFHEIGDHIPNLESI